MMIARPTTTRQPRRPSRRTRNDPFEAPRSGERTARLQALSMSSTHMNTTIALRVAAHEDADRADAEQHRRRERMRASTRGPAQPPRRRTIHGAADSLGPHSSGRRRHHPGDAASPAGVPVVDADRCADAARGLRGPVGRWACPSGSSAGADRDVAGVDAGAGQAARCGRAIIPPTAAPWVCWLAGRFAVASTIAAAVMRSAEVTEGTGTGSR